MYLESAFDGIDYPVKRIASFAEGITSERHSIQIDNVENDIYVSIEGKEIAQRGLIPFSEVRFSFSVSAAVFRLPKGTKA
jgi:hypothetical protein